MGSVLNGLGKTTVTFFHNFTALSVRLVFVVFGIPRIGILACLFGMLVSEILLVLMHFYSLWRLISFAPNVWDVLVKPAFCLAAALGIYRLFPDTLAILPLFSDFFWLMIRIGIVCICYSLVLVLLQGPGHRAITNKV